VYSSETALRPATVNTKRLRMAFTRRVVGQIWGQPLYVRGVPVGGRKRNVVYVATSENIVYGFDADDRTFDDTTKPLMSASLGAAQAIDGDFFHTITPSNGISGTPVIDLGNPADPGAGTLYVVAKLRQDNKFHIFALDLRSLAVRPNAAGERTGVIVTATAPGQGATTVSFDGSDHLNRPALLISSGHLIVAFGSGPKNDWDCAGFHGWVLSYSLPDLVQTGAFVTTPSAATGMGGIWQAGNGPAADDQGNVYVMTGNGHFQSTRGLPDLANAFVKLSHVDGVLRLTDWYSPPSREVLQACDLDLGSSGPAVLDGAGKVVGAGKSGILYVLNTDRMGGTDTALAVPGSWRGAPDCTRGQCFRVAENEYELAAKTKLPCNISASPDSCTGFRGDNWNDVVDSYPHVHGAPVAWRLGNGTYNLYVWPEQDFLKAYRFNDGQFSPNAIGSSTPEAAARASMPGALLSLSWDGTNPGTGVLWASRPDPDARQTAVGPPFVSILHDQQHFAFRTPDGSVWDSFFRRSDNAWHLQQVNFTGISTNGAVFVSVFSAADQQHFVYVDRAGVIQDAFYRRENNSWQAQQISANGYPPAGPLSVSAFRDQQHFAWRDSAGRLWDSFFVQADDRWHFQSINTNGHPAVTGPFVSVFDSADQQHFAYVDQRGNVWDSFFRRRENRWDVQQINTNAHVPVGGVFVSVFLDQQHFTWRDNAGRLWDSFFAQADSHWHFQQIATGNHPAMTDPFVSVFGADQQHFVYTDAVGNIWDSFFRRHENRWDFQKIDTHGHAPVPGAGVFVSSFFDQQHFAWTDAAGSIWDSFFAQTDAGWHFQQINTAFDCMSASGADLTPNGTPCNAINKNVRGFLEAFDATPRAPSGQLVEIWSSKAEHGEGVWFAKQSPPTIADGKVFLVGFPPPVPGQDWNTAQAFGRLIVYTLR
jgi:hypothetical protein